MFLCIRGCKLSELNPGIMSLVQRTVKEAINSLSSFSFSLGMVWSSSAKPLLASINQLLPKRSWKFAWFASCLLDPPDTWKPSWLDLNIYDRFFLLEPWVSFPFACSSLTIWMKTRLYQKSVSFPTLKLFGELQTTKLRIFFSLLTPPLKMWLQFWSVMGWPWLAARSAPSHLLSSPRGVEERIRRAKERGKLMGQD